MTGTLTDDATLMQDALDIMEARTSGESRSHAMMMDRIASGERAIPHVVRDVRFGPDRFVTCATCGETFTGRSDAQMAWRWDQHRYRAMRAYVSRDGATTGASSMY